MPNVKDHSVVTYILMADNITAGKNKRMEKMQLVLKKGDNHSYGISHHGSYQVAVINANLAMQDGSHKLNLRVIAIQKISSGMENSG